MLLHVGELAGALFKFLFQFASMCCQFLFQLGARFTATNARSSLRSDRTRLATVRFAFRTLARQVHPRGRSIDRAILATLKHIMVGPTVSEPRSGGPVVAARRGSLARR